MFKSILLFTLAGINLILCYSGRAEENNTVECIVAGTVYNRSEDKVRIDFSTYILNGTEKDIEVFFSFSQKGTNKNPGFTLPFIITLQARDKKEWIDIGDALKLATEPHISISSRMKKNVIFSIFVPLSQEKYLKKQLRILIKGHSITEKSWTAPIISQPFYIEDLKTSSGQE